MIRGLKVKESESRSEINEKMKKRKEIYGDLDDINLLKEGDDQHAVGLVESSGSFFNSFKPRSGVTIMEGLGKIKKGNKLKDEIGNISRLDYSKNYSHKPFELKGILANSQSINNLELPRKSHGISFYEEGSLPPIMSPRGRYNADPEEDTTQHFEIDQSIIEPKKNEETIYKAGDITELINLDKNLLDDTEDIKNGSKTYRKGEISVLPKYVNR